MTARVAECTFIAIGIVSYLAVVTLYQTTAGGTAGSLLNDARSLVAVRNWTFVLGPGFVAGLGNGLILGYMMYRSGLMPQGLSVLGLIGGTLICITGLGVVLDVFARGGTAQAIATIPEFLWELSLGMLSDRQRVQPIADPRGRPAESASGRGSLSLVVALRQSQGCFGAVSCDGPRALERVAVGACRACAADRSRPGAGA